MTHTRSSRRRARLLIPLAVAAAALPLTLATPAHAATTQDGCTVTAGTPEFRGTYDPTNTPYVFYPVTITCDPSPSGLDVKVKVVTWEQDLKGRAGDVDADGINNADDEKIGSVTFTRHFAAAGGTTTVDVRGVLPHTDSDGNEEPYQSDTFQVTSGPVTGSWSPKELSAAAASIWW